MWDSALVIVSVGVRYQYPDWSESEVEQEIAARINQNTATKYRKRKQG